MGLRIKVAVAVVLLAAAFAAGWQTNQWRLDARMEAERAAAEKQAKEQAQDDAEALGIVVDKAHAQLQARLRKEKVITREVTKYVERDRDPDDVCDLDSEWVRLHDKALPGGASGTAGEPDDPAGGGRGRIAAPRALGPITGNYAVCARWRDRLSALQDWVRRTRD